MDTASAVTSSGGLPAVLSFCRELVRIPSLTGMEQNLADAVCAEMAALKYDRVDTDSFGNVIGIREGQLPGPTVLLDGHMDVVPAQSPEAWQHDPFGGVLVGGRLYGRGAADTKSALAAMIHAVGKLPVNPIHGKIIMVASVCEENVTGAALGPVLDRFQPDVMLTGEPTGLRLGVAQKGRMTLVLRAQGRGAHTSNPQVGENAVYKMLEAVRRLRELPQPEDALLGSGVLELTEIISEPFPNGSIVPHGCRAHFIGRFMPDETREGALHRVQEALIGLTGMDVGLVNLRQECYTGAVIEMEDFLPGWYCAADDPWRVSILERLSKAGRPAEIFGMQGGTNASVAAGTRGIPSFIYGPGNMEQAHIVDEWVSVSQVVEAESAYQDILMACQEV